MYAGFNNPGIQGVEMGYCKQGITPTTRGKMTRRQFMRGTDPIKSTWVYPKLIM